MTEDGVRFGILGVTGNVPLQAPVNYENEVKYWTGREPQEFCRYLYNLGNAYMGSARAEINVLKERVKDLESGTAANEDTKNLQAIKGALGIK